MEMLKSIASLAPSGATIQSDHQGIDALIGDVCRRTSDEGVGSPTPGVTNSAFRTVDFTKELRRPTSTARR